MRHAFRTFIPKKEPFIMIYAILHFLCYDIDIRKQRTKLSTEIKEQMIQC